MKWYSVKKYLAPTETILIFRARHSDGSIAFAEVEASHDYSGSCFVEFHFDLYNKSFWSAAHFCIPDPVEIDE